jgi:hypothetical protein
MNVKDVGFLRTVFDGPVLNIALANCDTRLTGMGVENSGSMTVLGDEEIGWAFGILRMHDPFGKIKFPFANRPN